MKVTRDWATPLTIGSFGLLAVTGVLMFFHLDTPLNKAVHEWLSWVLLAAVGLHVTSNLFAFKRHFAQRRARVLVGVAALVLAVSFVPLGSAKSDPPFVAPAKALAAAPLPLLAQVAGVSTVDLRARLQRAGATPRSDADTVAGLIGPDTKRQIRVLSQVLASAPAAAGG